MKSYKSQSLSWQMTHGFVIYMRTRIGISIQFPIIMGRPYHNTIRTVGTFNEIREKMNFNTKKEKKEKEKEMNGDYD